MQPRIFSSKLGAAKLVNLHDAVWDCKTHLDLKPVLKRWQEYMQERAMHFLKLTHPSRALFVLFHITSCSAKSWRTREEGAFRVTLRALILCLQAAAIKKNKNPAVKKRRLNVVMKFAGGGGWRNLGGNSLISARGIAQRRSRQTPVHAPPPQSPSRLNLDGGGGELAFAKGGGGGGGSQDETDPHSDSPGGGAEPPTRPPPPARPPDGC